jgi:hypothetical protein
MKRKAMEEENKKARRMEDRSRKKERRGKKMEGIQGKWKERRTQRRCGREDAKK